MTGLNDFANHPRNCSCGSDGGHLASCDSWARTDASLSASALRCDRCGEVPVVSAITLGERCYKIGCSGRFGRNP